MEETGKQYVVVKYISGSMKVQSRHKRASTDTKVPTYPNNAGPTLSCAKDPDMWLDITPIAPNTCIEAKKSISFLPQRNIIIGSPSSYGKICQLELEEKVIL